MPKTKSGISQVGGKFRLCNTILKYIPYHEFFLSMFCGACWVELNKPRSRYECYNDLSAEIINYLVMIERYPKEFDEMKQGVYGLVSQEICNRIVRGELKPRNDLERAYFFYYLNKLTFGGDVKKVGSGKEAHAHHLGIWNPTDPCRQSQVKNIKDEFKTKGYSGLLNPAMGGRNATLPKERIEKVKKEYQTKGYSGLLNKGMSKNGYGRVDKNIVKNAKKEYEYKTKGFGGMINTRAGLPTLHKEDIENIKDEFETKGFGGLINTHALSRDGYGRVDSKVVEKAKASYRGIVPKASFAGINNTRAGNNASNMRDMDKWKKEFKDTVEESKKKQFKANYGGLIDCGNSGGTAFGKMPRKRDLHIYQESFNKASYKGIANHGATGWGTLESGEVEKAKEQYQAVSYKGINPKTTRPYHNNDCGLLTPLDTKAIERLRYVNLTCYDFKKVYKLFYNAFHVRKGLSRECFIYADPPYCGTEKYFGGRFPTENHQHLIDLILETPFNFMLSIGGECETYLEQLSDWVIVPVQVRYSTDATSQKKSQEYIIMNYEINDIGNMKQDNQASIMRFLK